jgi:hypothetical protein
MIFKEGQNPQNPTVVNVTNYYAYLTFANGAKAGENGVLTLASTVLPDGSLKVSHSFGIPVKGFAGVASWSINDSEAKRFPVDKTPGGSVPPIVKILKV